MGTPKRTSSVRRFLTLSILLCSGAALADPVATDKVIQFLTNAYTGEVMREADWLSQDVREAAKFRAFGGLDRLVKQSTARAHECKGLRSVAILDVKQEGEGYIVKAEVKFIEDHRQRESPAAAEREEVIWAIRVAKEKGIWRLRF